MVTRMKTTVELSDALLDEARRAAREDGLTLRALLEAGLRRELAERQPRREFTLREASFRGRGLQTAMREGGWERVRDAVYEGRGA